MTIYLDYIFIENFVIDYILLKETSYISRKEITHKRAILSSIVASTYVVFMICFKVQELNYLICKMLLGVVIIYICFQPKEINEYIKLITFFLLISVINVGTLTVISNLLNIQNQEGLLKLVIYILSLLLSKFFTNNIWNIYKRKIKNEDLLYDVQINVKGNIYKYKAFLDTGNSVYSYTYNLPVIFAELIDDNMLEKLEEKESFNIRTVTLSNAQDKKAYIFDNVEITNKKEKWKVKTAIVFENIKLAKDNSYNMLLNYNLYVQNMGGIKI